MNEAELLEGCKCGKKEAFEALYKLYSQRMYGVCYRYVGDDAARDVMHDGFLKVFSSIGQLRASDLPTFRTWITRVMVTTSLLYLRSRKNNFFLSIDDLKEEMQPIDEEEIISLPTDTLMKFIAELPVGYRTVLNLSVFEGYSHKEIAQATGINEHSSSSQLHRAKCMLAKKIKEYLNQQSL